MYVTRRKDARTKKTSLKVSLLSLQEKQSKPYTADQGPVVQN